MNREPSRLAPQLARVLSVVALVLAAGPASADKADDNQEQISILAEEIDKLRKQAAVPFEGDLESAWGLGPAASKIYGRERGLSIGGYGEVRFRGDVGDKDGGTNEFDALRAVLYFGYKFTDKLLVNMELEFEHAGTGGGGSVSTEFLTLDYLHADWLNFRGGLVLVPMGFINELHEPVFFYSNTRPEPERRIIPTTWRENGVGIFGQFADVVQYRMYAVNGLDASGFDSNGLRGGRQSGSETMADHWAFVSRVDVTPLDGLLLGASVYTGKSGQNQEISDTNGAQFSLPDTLTTIWEVHGQYKKYGLSLRGLWTQAHLRDTNTLSAALSAASGSSVVVAERMVGGYAEVGYDILPLFLPDTRMSLEPFYRFEHLDTQDKVSATAGTRNPARSRDFHIVGLHFEPHPQVVLKLDYRHSDADGSGNEIADEVLAGFGFVF